MVHETLYSMVDVMREAGVSPYRLNADQGKGYVPVPRKRTGGLRRYYTAAEREKILAYYAEMRRIEEAIEKLRNGK